LFAVFENQRRPVIQQPGGKDREHPTIGVR
jgi:hypothetical protein